MTIQQAIEVYLKNRSKRLAAKSINAYEAVLTRFSGTIGKNIELKAIREEDIDDFQLLLKQKVCETTQLHYATILRTFFKFWVARGQSSVIYEAIEGPRRCEHRPNFITAGQFDLINDFFDEWDYYQLTKKLIFNLLWDTGMRIGELLALDIADISSDKNYVVINTEKSKKLRMLVWGDQTHCLLMRYMGTRIALNQSPELFQTPGSATNSTRRTRLTSRSVQRWCKQLSDEVGFKINPHAFRHGKMHSIINQGGNRQHVQVIAGHSSIRSSEVYVRLNEQEQYKIQSKFLARKKKDTTIPKTEYPQRWVA